MFGYHLSEWYAESTVFRAQAIAHYVEHNLREGYTTEKMLGDKSGKSDDNMIRSANVPANIAMARQMMGLS